MFRPSLTLLATVVVLAMQAAPAASVWAAPQSAAELLDVPKLLDDLSHTDTAVRQRASERLVAIGEAARPQLIEAARSDDPERRVRAAEILRKLPWHTNADPRPIRTLLDRYGEADDRTRMSIIYRLSDATTDEAVDVMLRLLNEEPSDAVRWFIAALLTTDRRAATQKKVLALGVSADDPPVLVLVGNTLLERDRDRALKLFRRAIEAEEKRPGADIGVLALAFDALTDDALARGDVEEAAALLRRQVPRDGRSNLAYRRAFGQHEPHALPRLMALHTYFGPLRGYWADLAAWGNGGDGVSLSLDRQIVAFLARWGAAPPLPWQAMELTGEQHLAAGAFLLRNEFYLAAEAELRKALDARLKESPAVLDANALFALGQSTAARGDDEACANYLERAMHLKRTNGMNFSDLGRRQDDDVWAEIHWRRARAAHQRGDPAAADDLVKRLLHLTPTNSDRTIEMVNWLKESSRGGEAKRLFEKVYVQTRARLDASPDAEKPGMKNDLAWLCARVDERLDEAMKLAEEAVAAQPDNAAFLDTLAEACFRAGKVDDAIRHELRALELQPDDAFMKEQLERFRRGRK